VSCLFFHTGRKKVILFCLFWFFAFLIPSFASSDAWLAHRLYVPLIAIVISYCEFLSAAAQKVRLSKKYIVILLSVMVVLFSFTAAAQTGKFQNRKVFILNAAEEVPDSEMLLLKSAQYYAHKEMADEAVKAMGKIRTDNLRNPIRYLETLAYVYCMQDKFPEAVSVYQQLLAISPLNEASLYNMSEICATNAQYGEALKYAGKLAETFPENVEYARRLAEIELLAQSSAS
jgi:tetratricopeptide (TPR) repeat protein